MAVAARERPADSGLSRSGIYSVSEAAALLEVPSQKIRGWIDGWSGSSAPPMIENDLGWFEGKLAFSFKNLMELRFIAYFANAKIKIREIRSIMDEVRREIHRPNPFATNIVFRTDGTKIIAQIARRNGVEALYDLRSKNFELGGIVYETLKDDIIYDPKGDAQAWFPRRLLAPNVVINPRLAFGRPVLRGRGIPTEAIASAVRAEGRIDIVATLFEISKSRVQEAVLFENHLRRAA